ncbi:MAG: ATP synthase F1 subunit epsilon [Oscillospiraceae bacterium]|nr:ATP synthase F1 subunit epsilon [Oscillospiraceae bacterium]
MTPFNLRIITPDKVFFKGEIEKIIVRTTVGDKGILAKHEPYIAALPIGTMKIMIKGNYRIAAISPGTINVGENGDTVVIVQSCEFSDEIDVSRAKIAKKAAEERLSDEGVSIVDHDIAEFKLKRALNRLDAANYK